MKSAATQEPVARSWKRSLASGSAQLFGATLASNAGLFVARGHPHPGAEPCRARNRRVRDRVRRSPLPSSAGSASATRRRCSPRPARSLALGCSRISLLALTLTSVAGAVAVFPRLPPVWAPCG